MDMLASQKARRLTGWIPIDRCRALVLRVYIMLHVTYDTAERAAIQAGQITAYTPDPDEVLRTGKGTCSDYATLYASMLQAVGVEARVVMGYADWTDRYHTWTEITLRNTQRIADLARDGKNIFLPMFKNPGEYREC